MAVISKRLAVVLFVYNRPIHTREVLRGLAENPPENLVVFQDGLRQGHPPEPHAEVTRLIEGIAFAKVAFLKRAENLGLANSIIRGVTETFRDHDEVVVLEDDCVPSKFFLPYVRAALDFYRAEKRVFSIGGFAQPSFPRRYRYDACVSPLPNSWGWATWKDRWEKFDVEARSASKVLGDPNLRRRFNLPGRQFAAMLENQRVGKVDSWAIRWYLAHFVQGGVNIWPMRSFVRNIGHDGTGVNCNPTDSFAVDLAEEFDPKTFRFPTDLRFDFRIRRAFKAMYDVYTLRRLWDEIRRPRGWPRIVKKLASRVVGR